MKKLMRNQWDEFQRAIAAMYDNALPRDIANAILTWLRQYPETFLNGPFSDYSFDRFLSLQEEDYPVEVSRMRDAEFINFKKIIKKYSAEDAESIARFLRDTLETLVVLMVDKQCPRCEASEMGIYKNSEDGRIAFECRQCGFANYLDGAKVGTKKLTFALTENLHEAGFI